MPKGKKPSEPGAYDKRECRHWPDSSNAETDLVLCLKRRGIKLGCGPDACDHFLAWPESQD